MLHILNGDEAAQIFKETTIEGDTAIWRETLMEGPVTPAHNLMDFFEMREKYIGDTYGGSPADYRQKILSEWKKIEDSENEDIVLWFEFDFFCQVNLFFLLHFLSQRKTNGKVFLICPGQFPGIFDFKGLGQLNPRQLEDLYPERREFNRNDLAEGALIWKAFSSDTPGQILEILNKDFPAFPYLKTAFVCHLRRFPSTLNGLDYVEHKLLSLIREGYNQIQFLYQRIWIEDKDFGLGDLQILNYLLGLQNSPTPLITVSDLGSIERPNLANLSLWRFNLTDTGEDVLTGKTDWVRLNGIDRWLGGIHLKGKTIPWRYSQTQQTLVPTA